MSPDQGMMIHISVTQLLDCLADLMTGQRKAVSFTGADTSFELRFRSTKKGVKVAARSGPVALVSRTELARTVLSAAERHAASHLSSLPRGEGVADDYSAALKRFRPHAGKSPAGSATGRQMDLMRQLSDGAIRPEVFAKEWLGARRKALADGERMGEGLEHHLNQVFYALDGYPIDPALREEGDTTEAELLAAVEQALSLLSD
ncbi:colicin immunity domain-containing protein [Streptomyces sp. NBC_00536]|uniref:hypothetical protein n=1 Tax=Streptomyces sp. NBC_00536 TaxID=2975769 RepID=UPI002E81107F|nr:hypothetical protein [Streptomyces sp. NBC_00536]WUC80662.1 colicin immunity domain-containing protein [Streptomyces sp. NBC_00536]